MSELTLDAISALIDEKLAPFRGLLPVDLPETEADDVADGSFADTGLLSKNQLRRRAKGESVGVNMFALLFAKSKARRIVAGLETIEDIDDRPGELLDGDNIWDFMDANPQHYGTEWKENPANARPVYDD